MAASRSFKAFSRAAFCSGLMSRACSLVRGAPDRSRRFEPRPAFSRLADRSRPGSDPRASRRPATARSPALSPTRRSCWPSVCCRAHRRRPRPSSAGRDGGSCGVDPQAPAPAVGGQGRGHRVGAVLGTQEGDRRAAPREPSAPRSGLDARRPAPRRRLGAARRRSWCSRSAVASRRASTSPAARAATSSAVWPTLNTASSNGIEVRQRRARRRGRRRRRAPTRRTTGSRASGTRTTWPAAVATTPPSSDAATLSACPSSSVAAASSRRRASADDDRRIAVASLRRPRPDPPTRTAPLKPEPPAGRDRRAHPQPTRAAAVAERHRCRVVLVGRACAVAGSRRPVDDADLGVQGQRHPERVEPGPRFADDAGTRTIIPAPPPSGSVAARAWRSAASRARPARPSSSTALASSTPCGQRRRRRRRRPARHAALSTTMSRCGPSSPAEHPAHDLRVVRRGRRRRRSAWVAGASPSATGSTSNVSATPSCARASTVDGPGGRELVEPVAVHDHAVCRRHGCAARPASARRSAGSATPISWRRTRPGLAIGPSRLNTVGMPISRRDGAAKRNAGWNRGAKQKPIPASVDAAQRRRPARARSPRRGPRARRPSRTATTRPGAVLAHGHAGTGHDQGRHRRTLIECDRSPPVPTTSTARVAHVVGQLDELGRRQHGVEQPGQLVGGLALGPQGDDESDQLGRRRLAGQDRGHRRAGLDCGQVAPGEQLGEQAGPTAVLFQPEVQRLVVGRHGGRIYARAERLGGRSARASGAEACSSGGAPALADDPASFAFGAAAPDARLLARHQRVLEAGDAHAATCAHSFAGSASSSSSG